MSHRESNVQIKRIAEKAGFSPSTVSIVLSGRGDELRISKKTQELIRDVARSMSYQPNMYARRLRSGSASQETQIICVFWNDSFEDNIGPFIMGMNQYIVSSGCRFELMIQLFPTGMLSEYKPYFSSQKYSGIIVGHTSQEDLAFLEANEFDVPIVISGVVSGKYSHIYLNSYHMGEECAADFARHGVRSAAYLGCNRAGGHSALRQLGFTTVCGAMGIEVRPEWLLNAKEHSMADGYRAAKEFLSLPERPEAIFIDYSYIAMGALFAFHEEKVRIPDELKIVVYGTDDMLRHMSPSITTLVHSMRTTGSMTMELLHTLMKNDIPIPISRMAKLSYGWGDSFPKLENE